MTLLLKALHFAALKHTNQRRKNASKSPYINHPIEVAEHLHRVGGGADETILAAALLHDTIEDTGTTEDELRREFGAEVLALVLECTDDKTLEKAERKRLQIENAPMKSPGAKQIKIADATCNLRSILEDPPEDWSIVRKIEYFHWAEKVVEGLKGTNPRLDQAFDEILEAGLQKLKEAEQNMEAEGWSAADFRRRK
jgi:guanosine-3',5'-bis(diphosphate) 3'-pyrophosphohydrolase